MRLSRGLETIVRLLAGRDDAGSMLADLQVEAAERAAVDGEGPARRWVWRQVARSSPTLVARQLDRTTRLLTKGPPMLLSGLWLDLSHVLRRLRRSPGFALLAVGMLGLGIGAATSVFSLAYTLWLKPLPYAAPDRLASLVVRQERTGFRAGSSGAELEDIRANVSSFSAAAGYHYGAIFVRFDGEPVRLVAYPVSPNLFGVLGVPPQIGRTFTPSDQDHSVAVLSDAFWRSRYHADPHIVGQTLRGLAEEYTIIGVMPRDFHFPLQLEADCWVPQLAKTGDRSTRLTDVVARLAPGATLERATAELTSLAARLATAYPTSNTNWTMRAEPIAGPPSASYRAAFTTLLSMVALFLLIACANLASLFVARNLARRTELTVTLSIGAPRWRLGRAVLIESAFVSLLGGAAALVLDVEALQAFAHWLPPSTPRLNDLRVNGAVYGFACLVAVVTAAACAIAPIAGIRSLRLADTLLGTRTVVGSSNVGQYALVTVELALAAVLLMGGGAMVRSFTALLNRDRGYVPAGVTTMTVLLPFDQKVYETAEARAFAFGQILDGVRQVPGVTAAGAATGFPGSSLGVLGVGPVTAPGRTDRPVVAVLHNATPDYFHAMGVALKRGRFFARSDTAASPPVVLINEALEHQLWPDGKSLGQHFTLPPAPGLMNHSLENAEVVGVVADMHLNDRRNNDIFVPLAQVPGFWADVVVRATGDPEALSAPIRQAVYRSTPDTLIEHVSPMQAIISNAYGLERAQSFLTALVAALGGIIALLGLYALLNQYVARRTRELGVCLALGASPDRLFWSVFRRGMQLSAAGIAIGFVIALGAVRVLRGQVFGLDAPVSWFFVCVALGIAAVAAIVIATSARRVIAIDPLLSIRQV
jgi:putative ABC transport system permease protein